MDSEIRRITRIKTDHWLQNWVIDEASRRGSFPAPASGGITKLNTADFIDRMEDTLLGGVKEIYDRMENIPTEGKEIGIPTIRKIITEAKSIAEEADTKKIEYINNR